MSRLAALLILAVVAPLSAQQTAPPTGAVAPLAYMVGQWEGPAWIDLGPGGRHELRQREWVTTAAGGNVLTIVGQGTETLPDGTQRLAHDAFAVMYPDRDGNLAFRAFRGETWLDPQIVLGEQGFVWSFTDPRGGRIKYTMTHTAAGEWNEIGEREVAGGNWVKFFEMTLRRVP
jgi:hypothetical protein